MKIEIGKEFPGYFKSLYPEEFQLFSHFETTVGMRLFSIRESSVLEWMLCF